MKTRSSKHCLPVKASKEAREAATAIRERTFKLSPGENLYVPFPLLVNLYFSVVGASLLACTQAG